MFRGGRPLSPAGYFSKSQTLRPALSHSHQHCCPEPLTPGTPQGSHGREGGWKRPKTTPLLSGGGHAHSENVQPRSRNSGPAEGPRLRVPPRANSPPLRTSRPVLPGFPAPWRGRRERLVVGPLGAEGLLSLRGGLSPPPARSRKARCRSRPSRGSGLRGATNCPPLLSNLGHRLGEGRREGNGARGGDSTSGKASPPLAFGSPAEAGFPIPGPLRGFRISNQAPAVRLLPGRGGPTFPGTRAQEGGKARFRTGPRGAPWTRTHPGTGPPPRSAEPCGGGPRALGSLRRGHLQEGRRASMAQRANRGHGAGGGSRRLVRRTGGTRGPANRGSGAVRGRLRPSGVN